MKQVKAFGDEGLVGVPRSLPRLPAGLPAGPAPTATTAGNDYGTQYRSGLYYHSPDQQRVAEAAVRSIPRCAVEVEEAREFWPAEEYHQKYLEKGGRNGRRQSAAKGCQDPIRCYG